MTDWLEAKLDDGPADPTEVELQAWIDANSTGVTVTAAQILENMSVYDTHITTLRAMVVLRGEKP